METKGLSTTEASLLFAKIGPNKIADGRHINFLGRFFGEAFNFLNILLLIAAVVSFAIADIFDGILIIAIIILNSVITFWQEFKAERTLDELRNLSHSFTRVIRDGKETAIDSEQLVPGDVIVLEIGDKIPADGRVLEAVNFEVSEASLTGESIPVYKKPDEEEHNQVFAGTIASSGRAKVLIFATGSQTRFGKIAATLEGIKETETPLQKEISRLTLNVAFLATGFSAAIYLVGIYLGHDRTAMFLTAVSAAVAAIPEGLPAIIIITLAVGVKKMALRRAVIRKMVAVEALGSINVICTDKTGTLTLGEMRATKLWFEHKFYSPIEFKHVLGSHNAKRFVDAFIVPNTSSLTFKFDHGTRAVLGDATEGALLMLGQTLGVDYELHRNQGKILDEFSFDQKRKTMSAVWQYQDQILALVKGAPEYVVNAATRIAERDGIKLLNEEHKQKLVDAYKLMASAGLRVLGFGYKDKLADASEYHRDDIESDLIFLGFIGLHDPVRPEARDSIKHAMQAGIKTVMITGDNELTAVNVAKELGLATEGEEVILGKDLEKMTDEQLNVLIWKVKIFARTNPEDKLRIVQAFQRGGLAVAVTGDGVNDALALKQAEIGIAMGKKGTDVAKEAADMVITDDNYSTIVRAVEEGRTIYDNVLNAIRYLISTNISELLVIFIAIIAGLPSPLVPAQILWINLVSDGFPAIALALEHKDPSTMRKLPRSKKEGILNINAIGKLFWIGLVVSLISLLVYRIILKISGDLVLARTWTFTVLVVLQMLVAFIIRGKKKHHNRRLILAVLITLMIQAVILTVPIFHPIFKITNPW